MILACTAIVLSACSVQQRADLLGSPEDALSASSSSSAALEFFTSSQAGEEPFIAEKREAEEEERANRPVVNVKPGVPYIAENPQEALPCMNDPIADKRGKLQYPVSDTYAHLTVIGQLFTALDCGPKRTAQLPSVSKERYMAGSTVWLTAAPSWMLRDALKDAGYRCILNVPELDCKRWQVKTPVSLDLLAALRPFTKDMEKEACVSCW